MSAVLNLLSPPLPPLFSQTPVPHLNHDQTTSSKRAIISSTPPAAAPLDDGALVRPGKAPPPPSSHTYDVPPTLIHATIPTLVVCRRPRSSAVGGQRGENSSISEPTGTACLIVAGAGDDGPGWRRGLLCTAGGLGRPPGAVGDPLLLLVGRGSCVIGARRAGRALLVRQEA